MSLFFFPGQRKKDAVSKINLPSRSRSRRKRQVAPIISVMEEHLSRRNRMNVKKVNTYKSSRQGNGNNCSRHKNCSKECILNGLNTFLDHHDYETKENMHSLQSSLIDVKRSRSLAKRVASRMTLWEDYGKEQFVLVLKNGICALDGFYQRMLQNRWKDYFNHLKILNEKIQAAAFTVTRFFRQIWAKEFLKKLRQEKLAYEEIQERKLELAKKVKRDKAASRIQSYFWVFQARNKLSSLIYMRRIYQAALIIGSQWRCYAAKCESWVRREERERFVKFSICIQRWWRTIFRKRHNKLISLIRQVELKFELKTKSKLKIIRSHVLVGAAIRLQNWGRRMNYVQKLMKYVNYYDFLKMEKAAVLCQTIQRSKFAALRVHSMKCTLIRCVKASIIIQCNVRRFIVCLEYENCIIEKEKFLHLRRLSKLSKKLESAEAKEVRGHYLNVSYYKFDWFYFCSDHSKSKKIY